jgi:L-seryl-tRNA(Ser) seleniumtransferase
MQMGEGMVRSGGPIRGTWTRRRFFGSSAAAALAALVRPQAGRAQAVGSPLASARQAEPPLSEGAYRDNIYTRLLGIRPHLPAHEHISRLGGSRMPPEVMRAMADANEFFVDMHELSRVAGQRVATLLGAEAAVISSGAYATMVLGAAACLTGSDQEKVVALPLVTWPKRECLMQKAHRFSYDRAFRAAGMTIVEVETREQFAAAISERTAMIAGLAAVGRQKQWGPPVPRHRAVPVGPEVMLPEELIAVGRKGGVPVMIDTASEIPPEENLTRFFRLGADLVVFSGGKAFRGPQSTGILAGRRDLVEAAALNNSPNDNLGRGFKVGKEETIGLIVALERYVKLDKRALHESWARKARYIAGELAGIPGLKAEAVENTTGVVDVDLSWDETVFPMTHAQVRARLMEGEPRLAYDGTTVRARNLRDGEEELVARRLRQFFQQARPR